MNELDLFLTHLFCNIENEDITLSKKMKYGYRNYYLNVNVEKESETEDTNNNSIGNKYYSLTSVGDFCITIDNRNKCIDIFSNFDNLTVESEDLVNKWTEIFEDYIKNGLEKEVSNLINNVFSNSNQKNLLRDYKLKKMDI
jgi:hemerythrin-like domain-containing protein